MMCFIFLENYFLKSVYNIIKTCYYVNKKGDYRNKWVIKQDTSPIIDSLEKLI